MRLKSLLSLFLCLTLLWGSVMPASAASATATDMRLEKAEGTVKLENASGRSISVRDGMKLYKGYTVKTEAKSYAYLMLDDEKAVKLDENSALEVRKTGKKLELLVTKGEIFFNVKAPLAAGETMNIRTSTMVTGIRGTSGYVAIDEGKSSLTILDGSAQISLPDGSAALQVAAGMTGHATATFTTLEPLNLATVPGFVAVELASDPVLADRIEQGLGQPIGSVTGTAGDRLAADQASSAAANPPAAVTPRPSTVFMPSPIELGMISAIIGQPVAPTPTPPTPPTPPVVTTGSITVMVSVLDEQNKPLVLDTPATYAYTYTGPDGVARPFTVTVAAGQSVGQAVLGGLALGSYTIQAPGAQAPTGVVSGGVSYTRLAVAGVTTVTLTDSMTAVTVDDPYHYRAQAVTPPTPVVKGSITLHVALTDDAKAALPVDQDTIYRYTCTAANGVAQTVDVVIAAGQSSGSATLRGLEMGSYSISPANATAQGGTLTVKGTTYTLTSSLLSSASLTLTEQSPDLPLNFGFSYAPKQTVKGSVTVNLRLNVNGTTSTPLVLDAAQTYTYTCTGPDGVARPMTITIAAGQSSGSATLSDLPLGSYTVSPTNLPAMGSALTVGGVTYTLMGTSGDTSFTLTDAMPTMTVDDSLLYRAPTGSVVLEVNLQDEDGNAIVMDTATDFPVTVRDSNGTATVYAISVAAGASSGSFTVGGLALGTYYVDSLGTGVPSITVGGVLYNLNQSISAAATSVTLSGSTTTASAVCTYPFISTVKIVTEAITVTQLESYYQTYTTVRLAKGGSLTVDDSNDHAVEAGKTLVVMDGGEVNISKDYSRLFVANGAKMEVMSGGVVNIGDDTSYDSALAINKGAIMINAGTVHVGGGGELALSSTNDVGGLDHAGGTLNNSGTILLDGMLCGYSATMTNSGTITRGTTQAGSVHFYSEYVNNQSGALSVVKNLAGAEITSCDFTLGGCEMQNAGTINLVEYSASISGSMSVDDAIFENTGTINIGANAKLSLYNNSGATRFTNTAAGMIAVNGTFYLQSFGDQNLFDVTNAGSLTVNSGAAVELYYATFTNTGNIVAKDKGTVLSSGTFNNQASLILEAGSALNMDYGEFTNAGTLDVYGTVSVTGNAYYDATSGTTTSITSFVNTGTLNVKSGGEFNAEAINTTNKNELAGVKNTDDGEFTIEVGGTLNISGDFYNTYSSSRGNLYIDGGVNVLTQGYFSNANRCLAENHSSGTISNAGTIINAGTFYHEGDYTYTTGTFTNTGTLNDTSKINKIPTT